MCIEFQSIGSKQFRLRIRPIHIIDLYMLVLLIMLVVILIQDLLYVGNFLIFMIVFASWGYLGFDLGATYKYGIQYFLFCGLLSTFISFVKSFRP